MKKIAGLMSFWGSMIGSMLFALHLSTGLSILAFVLFTLSNISSLYLSRSTDTPKEIILQLRWYILFNIVGIFRLL